MPKLTTDSNITWYINQDNMTWTLVRTATIMVNSRYGILENGFGNQIEVLGDIVAKGSSIAAIRFKGDDSKVDIGPNAVIDAIDGVRADGMGSSIINRGVINADAAGIRGAHWNEVQNYGTINSAFGGMQFAEGGSQIFNYGDIDSGTGAISTRAGGTYIFNAQGATMRSFDGQVYIVGEGDAKVVNRGDIYGAYGVDDAIVVNQSDLKLVNTGAIHGDIRSGAGEDRLDFTGGKVTGDVQTGAGDDWLDVRRGTIEGLEHRATIMQRILLV